MELIKLTGIVGASGASFASGSVLSDTSLHLFPVHVSPRSVPSGKHFRDFDLDCVWQDSWTPRSVFNNLWDREKIKEEVTQGLDASSYDLSAPSASTTGEEVKGCFRTIFHQIDSQQKKTIAVTMEMAVSKGNKGIILMSAIANKKDNNEGKASIFRALFLEKKQNGYRWEIKGGIQWSDESLKKAKKLKWEGFDRKAQEINWEDSTGSEGLKKDPFSLSWDSDSNKDKNIYQQLTITEDPSTKTPATKHGFWSGNAEPLTTNPKASAVFVNDVWAKTTGNLEVNNVKDWFNLFKDVKGSWK